MHVKNHHCKEYCVFCTIKTISCFFLGFASVQIRETYPSAKGKLKSRFYILYMYGREIQKFDLFHLSTKETLNKEYIYKIITICVANNWNETRQTACKLKEGVYIAENV
jgi:CRISPR/Cas system-associated protein Cas10 (large subunit of type III CRISPR-Cas system)